MRTTHYIPITSDVPGSVSQQTRALLRRVIKTTLAQEGVDLPCEIDVLFTDDAGIQAINQKMRQVDKPTDVLSFPQLTLQPGDKPSEDDLELGSGLVPLGDMVISMERAIAQAKEFGHPKRRELAYLAVHSTLHLLGYDHMDEGPQKALMRAHEESALEALGITREKQRGIHR